jgi:hypothetical protein
MMVDLIDKLIDRIIQLVNHRKERGQKVVTDILEPLLDSFNEVHESYMNTFKQLHTSLQSSSSVIADRERIFNQLYVESIFNWDKRSSLYNAISKANIDDNIHTLLIPLVNQIEAYLDLSVDNIPFCLGVRFQGSIPRLSVLPRMRPRFFEFSSEDQEYFRKLMVNDVETMVSLLQSQYKAVMIEYSQVRRLILGA